MAARILVESNLTFSRVAVRFWNGCAQALFDSYRRNTGVDAEGLQVAGSDRRKAKHRASPNITPGCTIARAQIQA